ncbi:unnamed protein product [Adineta steineri]|uniref:Protein FAM221A n=1 Tax=Adineta steineri TaxID=433720 RepID=A0A814FHJ3_9BILA|nr:unnamed protein product [Adineta steineri]CAF1497967.1 unnamed protein product [Adineta steineri]
MAESNRGRAPGDYISLSPNAVAHVDAYFEYRRLHNRLYVSWVNPQCMDCIIIGSQHKCLCRNKFSEHKIDFTEIPTERPILISCRCVSFEYVANASDRSDPNCRCKHSLDTYGTRPLYTCQKKQCGLLTGYATPYKAMGGLTGFSSLAEGYLRLDPSG